MSSKPEELVIEDDFNDILTIDTSYASSKDPREDRHVFFSARAGGSLGFSRTDTGPQVRVDYEDACRIMECLWEAFA